MHHLAELRALFLINPNNDNETSGKINDHIESSADIYYISYIIIGILLILANAPIIVNILRHSVLRAKKEYLLFAGLAYADMLGGWGTLVTGVYRHNLIEKHEVNKHVSLWYCVKTPLFILLTYSMTVQVIMLLIISIDRFIAITWPFTYVKFTRRYSICMIACCYILAAIYTSSLMVYAYIVNESTPTLHAVCIVGEIGALFTSRFYVRLCVSTLSVLVYAIVWYLFRRYQKATVTAFPTFKTHLRRTQRRLTTTVGICALFTLVFFVIPTMLMYTKLNKYIWGPIYWYFNCINAVVNVFIYSLRHRDIRQGLKMLFKCEELPSPAAQRLRTESTSSLSVTQKAAFIVMEQMGIVVPTKPMFRQLRSASNPT